MSEIRFKKSEGQHMLKNPGVIDTIINKSRLKHTDVALEIGSGTGNITMKLLQKARKVIAFESDKRLIRELTSRVNKMPEVRNKLELIEGDVLYHDFPPFDICISNIPFNISCPIILKLLSCDFKCSYLLVQKEFGDRLVARPGTHDYSRLSVIVQLLSNVEHIMRVSKNSFNPPPKVDACFVKLEPKIPRPPIDITEFDNLLKICFVRKNKTPSSNLKSSYLISKIEKLYQQDKKPEILIDEILEKTGMQDMRTAKMTIEDFLRLLLEFKRVCIHLN